MPSFICKHAPWTYCTVAEYQHKNDKRFFNSAGHTHVVCSGLYSHSVHHTEAGAKAMAERLNLLAAQEIMTGERP
jgi:hypothetical protein